MDPCRSGKSYSTLIIVICDERQGGIRLLISWPPWRLTAFVTCFTRSFDATMTAIIPGADSTSEPSSPSASFDLDHDTDIDSVDANTLDHHYSLPPPDHNSPHEPIRQHPPRHSSLAPDEQTHPGLKPPQSPASDSQANEKYEFDDFWNQFHKKRRRKPDLPDLNIYNNPEYGFDGSMDGRRGPYNARAYELPHDRHTLIPFIRNGWQANVHSGWSSPTDHTPSWTQVLSAPKIRRWILVFFVSLSLSWLYWRRYGADAWTEHRMLNGAVSDRLKSDLGYFGTNMLPEFVGITQVKTLDTYFVPGSMDSRRLIFIGDVHGCREECMSALYLQIQTLVWGNGGTY